MLHAQDVDNAHTADYLAKMITDVLQSWKITTDRIQLVLRGNVANMVEAMRVAGLPNVGCMVNTMQLVVNDALKSQRAVMDMISVALQIVGHFKHSALAYNRLKQYQELHKLPEHRLAQDERTRWNITNWWPIKFCISNRYIQYIYMLTSTADEVYYKIMPNFLF